MSAVVNPSLKNLDAATRLVLNLNLSDEAWSPEVLEKRVDLVLNLLAGSGNEVPDRTELIRKIESLVNVTQDDAFGLTDKLDHDDWLSGAKQAIEWKFWERYRQYMEDVQLQPRRVIRTLDNSTDSILSKLENPRRIGPWDRRGLVVGQVQSGKTGNYTGLICKAADAGYKLIVVLAGIHNSLRSQTQLRLDQGFLGFDTQFQQRSDQNSNQHYIGVGQLQPDRLRAASLTTSAETGDFNYGIARNLALPIGDYPVILVVKKHTGILSNIHSWVTAIHGSVDAQGKNRVSDIPLLIIDDEADNASIDTNNYDNDPNVDPTKVNRAIRLLLRDFTQSAYVGYTATPFANIFINAYREHDEYGEDLFPRSFIEMLHAPSNYFGPERVFGLANSEQEPLPIFRPVNDSARWIPTKHNKHWVPDSTLPETLVEALRTFVLATAARRARGQLKAHNSMLIHVSRFQDVQDRAKEQIEDEIWSMKDEIRYQDRNTVNNSGILGELENLWVSDFELNSVGPAWTESNVQRWSDVRPQIYSALETIQLKVLNGKAKDALDYYERREEGVNIIAIGGDKLSRGLTLEGLTVSYYLRATTMYDTLMQMGRWFGYRPNYEDVCRLYTTADLYDWYREITAASNELKRELEEMADQGATPAEYGLRVKASAAGLSVTAGNKMRSSQRLRVSFSGGIPETTVFDASRHSLKHNLDATDNFASAIQSLVETSEVTRRHTATRNILWSGVPSHLVSNYLRVFRGDVSAVRSRPDLIAKYIEQCNSVGELMKWDILLVSNESSPKNPVAEPHRRETIGDLSVGLTTRELLTKLDKTDMKLREAEIVTTGRYTIRRILSPVDETQNLSAEQLAQALLLTQQRWEKRPGTRSRPTVAGGPELRAARKDDQALLIIYILDNSKYLNAVPHPLVGFAVSFPVSERNVVAEYEVNDVWQRSVLAELNFNA
ncbi:Z1 domain-containing protein [Rhodococcus fascians]|nr:Z1 domain-containing protein [Rhodococcus fascians]MBY3996315.1 Z1 domain-containing protein [Rhodococcus fascians]MBY4002970.1 Z1 domain-containing protein [Rhodococcus fascians]MBY4007720.1 Z1 domain-containing protein [Rhodococcus fascians]MBY4017527.1 Z1 domain-containing protein [Rhodococcus fascians]